MRNKRSQKQEELLAREHGGRTQPASGALPGRKGDVSFTESGWTIEAKYTDKERFSVTKAMIDKIKRAANTSGDNWMIQIDFCDPYTKKPVKRVAVIDYDVLMEMSAQLGEEDER